jgi:4-hydroxybenzoate polyprenyltransferase
MDIGDVPRWDPGKVSSRRKLSLYMKLIRIEHTLFSLPFAYAGALLSGIPTIADIILICLAVLGLRTAGMAYNNIADIDIDSQNPRTMNRPLVRGVVSPREAWMIVVIGSILYFISAALLNFYAFLLSPLLWMVIMTYPHAKRWHSFPHLHLGLSLGMVVFGGAVAVIGKSASSIVLVLESVPYVYILAVALWVSGFDILYSIMDIEFDRAMGLGSVPAVYGVDKARIIALAMHLMSISFLVLGYVIYGLGLIGLLTTLLASSLMIYQHLLAMESLSNIPRAFNMNLAISLIISFGIVAAKAFILSFL